MDDEIRDFRAVGRGRFELFDHILRRIELRRDRLDLFERAGCGVAEVERRGREEAARADERKVRRLVRRAKADRKIVGQFQPRAGPAAAGLWRIDKGAALDVAERADQQFVARRADSTERIARAGCPDELRLGAARRGLDLRQVHFRDRASGERGACHRPGFVEADDHATVDEFLQIGLFRDRQALRAGRRDDEGLRMEGVERAINIGKSTALTVAQHAR